MPAIVMTEAVARRHHDRLDELSGRSPHGPLDLRFLQPGTALADQLDGADGVFVSLDFAAAGGNIRDLMDVIATVPSIRWVHIGWAGSDSPMVQRLLDQGVTVTHSAGATAEPIALSAIGGMLVLHRGFNRWFRQQAAHEWKTLPRDQAPRDLRGQTMTIFGLGSIGDHIARFARALGLHVIGVRRTPADHDVHEWLPPCRLAEALPRTDWLTITAPLTAATRRTLDDAMLRCLKPGAHIINVSRGGIIDEQAMICALQEGRIAGAYLDVFDKEPLSPESPLWDMPNVVISPHDSWPSHGNNDRIEAIFLEELGHWLAGEHSPRVVTER